MRRRVSVAVAIAVLAAGWSAGERKVVAEARPNLASTSAATPAATPGPVTMEVKIDNFSFGPTTITVAVGTTVTWTNRDDIPHTVVSTDGVFKSKVMDTDEEFSFTFTKAGTFAYFCSIHPKMTGTVVVQ